MGNNYIALVADPDRKDTIVFAVDGEYPEQARKLIRAFYKGQGWSPLPVHIKLVRLQAGTQFIGHAMAEYEQEQIKRLCEKLLDQADSADLLVERDELYEFVAQFDLGKEAIKKRIHPDDKL